jgi:hypothetical protein
LIRRRDWIEGRCAVKADKGENVSYDEAELSALKWALPILFKRYGITEEQIPPKRNI